MPTPRLGLVALVLVSCFGEAPSDGPSSSDASSTSSASSAGTSSSSGTSTASGSTGDATSATTITQGSSDSSSDPTVADTSSETGPMPPCPQQECVDPGGGYSGPHLLRMNPTGMGEPPPCPGDTASVATTGFVSPSCECTCGVGCSLVATGYASSDCTTSADDPVVIDAGECEEVSTLRVRITVDPPATCDGEERTVTWCEPPQCGESAWCSIPEAPDAMAFPFGLCLRCEDGDCGQCPPAFPTEVAMRSPNGFSPSQCSCCDTLDTEQACVGVTSACDGGGSPLQIDTCLGGVDAIGFDPPRLGCEAPSIGGPTVRACCEHEPE